MRDDPRIIKDSDIETLASERFMCLRNKLTGRIENVSYTNDGLKMTVDKSKRLMYYDSRTTKLSVEYSPVLKHGKKVEVPTRVSIYGSFKLNTMFEAVVYEPRNHFDRNGKIISNLQGAELFGVSKAFALKKEMNSRNPYDAKLIEEDLNRNIYESKTNETMLKKPLVDVTLVPRGSVG
jgi:hypothetical protein